MPTDASSDEVHGHEVISMIMHADTAYTRESLAAAIRMNFGPTTRFYTCSASGLNPEELIAFLEERGKFIPREGGITIDPDRVCRH
ncbi:MAG TPA: YecH family metal-binding protein [Opitutaceae bacterium]|nr:YecH family metal-binding protein [Opitutaceae bacterium]